MTVQSMIPSAIHTAMKTMLLVCTSFFIGACVSMPGPRSVQSLNLPPPLLSSPSSLSTPPFTSQTEINQSLAAMADRIATVPADYRVGPQDKIEITLFNVPIGETGITPRTTEVRISQTGVIGLPLLGEFRAAGLTTTALENELRGRYKKYLHDPQVGVIVKEFHSQRVSVLGAVQRPGVFELTGPKNVVDVLALAGGVTDKAGGQVHLSRNGADGQQRYVLDLQVLASGAAAINLPLQADDVIDVPRAGTFFVDGAVHRPGSYPLERPHTLTQALATAGGIDIEVARLDGVTIFRHQGTVGSEAIPVAVSEILAGRMADPAVEANDVLFVPTSVPKYVVHKLLGTIGMGISLH